MRGEGLWPWFPDKRLTGKTCSHPHWPGWLGKAGSGNKRVPRMEGES